MDWKLAEAKNKLTEVVNRALAEGPQRIQRRDDTVLVLAEADYERLRGGQPTLKDHLLQGPGLQRIPLTRDRSAPRETSL
ncbi:MAG: prevent-host-death protein [Planctomycetes bacterium]|jgi:prevent-host-death family protein|nr:prevent-host-death protein [Planctomycetota bacterium]